MKRISITIEGVPQALKRHRAVRAGKFIRTYDPSSKDKEDFSWKAISKLKPDSPFTGPISLVVVFYMPRPKSHYGSGKNASILKKSAPSYHVTKPDTDNLLKFVKDAFNKIYWKDDSQVYLVTAQKCYTELTPRTEVEIVEVE